MPESCCKTPTSKECGLRIHPSSISFTVQHNSLSSFLTLNIWCSKVSREFFFNVYASFIHQAVLLRSFLAYALDPLYVAIHYFPKWLLATFTFSWIQEDACGILQMLTLSDYKMRPSSLLTHSIINTPYSVLKVPEKIRFFFAGLRSSHEPSYSRTTFGACISGSRPEYFPCKPSFIHDFIITFIFLFFSSDVWNFRDTLSALQY